jgi:phage-related protein
MVVAIVIIFAAIVALACVVGRKISSINDNVDEIFHKLFNQEGELLEHKNRLDAHFKDIVSNQKRIDEVDTSLYNHIKDRCINNAYSADERGRAESVIIAKYGEQSLRSISRELGIPATTINRWTKALKTEGKLQ